MIAITVLLNIILLLLKIIGIVLAVALLILLLALCLRVNLTAKKNDDGILVRIRYGKLCFTLYPPRKKKTKTEAEMKVPEKPTGFDFSQIDAGETICLALEVLDDLKEQLVIDRLRVEIRAASSDAARTAQLYGNCMALSGMVYPFLAHNFVMKECRIEITPDFDHTKISWQAETDCYMRPIGALTVLWKHRKELYRLYKQIQKEEAKEV